MTCSILPSSDRVLTNITREVFIESIIIRQMSTHGYVETDRFGLKVQGPGIRLFGCTGATSNHFFLIKEKKEPFGLPDCPEKPRQYHTARAHQSIVREKRTHLFFFLMAVVVDVVVSSALSAVAHFADREARKPAQATLATNESIALAN